MGGYAYDRDPASFTASGRGRSPMYNEWGEISRRLESDSFRIESVLDARSRFDRPIYSCLPYADLRST